MLIPPKNFNSVADALHRHLVQSGVSPLFHYLDDYIMVATPDPQLCQMWLDTLECARLGVSIASHKTEGPATTVTFLGIQIDAGKGKLRLSQEKLQCFCDLLEEWGYRKGYIRKGLETLIGQLNHTCKDFRVGRSFLCRMIDLPPCSTPSSFE